MVDMAIEVQVERMRVSEMMSARDAAVQRLSDAYESLHQKTAIIESLKQEPNSPIPSTSGPGTDQLEIARLRGEISSLEAVVKSLRQEIKSLKEHASSHIKSIDLPPQYDETYLKVSFHIFKTLHSISPGSSRTLESRSPLPSFRCHDSTTCAENGLIIALNILSTVSMLCLSKLAKSFSLAHP